MSSSSQRRQRRHVKKQLGHLSPKERAETMAKVKKIQEDPHMCNRCFTGRAYFEGRLVCYCWPEAELKAYEAELNAGLIVLEREENDVRYYKRAS